MHINTGGGVAGADDDDDDIDDAKLCNDVPLSILNSTAIARCRHGVLLPEGLRLCCLSFRSHVSAYSGFCCIQNSARLLRYRIPLQAI